MDFVNPYRCPQAHNYIVTFVTVANRVMGWACGAYGWGEGMYRVLVVKPQGRRPLGRPRRRWVDNISTDLQEVGCEYMDWIGLVQGRDSWRTLLSAVPALIRRCDDWPATIKHVPVAAVLVLNTPDDGRLRPKHVEWPCRNKTCTVLHQVGVSTYTMMHGSTKLKKNSGTLHLPSTRNSALQQTVISLPAASRLMYGLNQKTDKIIKILPYTEKQWYRLSSCTFTLVYILACHVPLQ